jgi:hypothetical protein
MVRTPLEVESSVSAAGVDGALHSFDRTFTPYPIPELGAGYTRSLAAVEFSRRDLAAVISRS